MLKNIYQIIFYLPYISDGTDVYQYDLLDGSLFLIDRVLFISTIGFLTHPISKYIGSIHELARS